MEKLINCLTELEKLKTIERGLNVGNRKESSAEHSWSCILIADILIDFVPEPLDRLRVFEILLYHDVVEIYAGDAKFNDPEQMRFKKEREEAGLKKIISIIPNSARYQSLMQEYETRASREAEFAKAIDCLDACLRNLNDTNNNDNEGFTEELIRSKYKPHVTKFDLIDNLFEIFMKRLRKNGRFS